MSTKTRFEEEAKGNSEMAYFLWTVLNERCCEDYITNAMNQIVILNFDD